MEIVDRHSNVEQRNRVIAMAGKMFAPFRKVDKATSRVLDEVVYLTADEEDEFIVAQANEPLDEAL